MLPGQGRGNPLARSPRAGPRCSRGDPAGGRPFTGTNGRRP